MIGPSGIRFKIRQVCLLTLSFTMLLSWSDAHVSELDSENIKSLPFDRFRLGEEFDSALILCLEQDDLGFIWIGTDRGLFRFDGHRFVHYTHSEEDDFSLQGDFVYEIFLDSGNRLLIGTDRGLHAYRSETNDFEHLPLFESAIQESSTAVIRRIAETGNGQLYIGTFGGGVKVLDRDSSVYSLSQITQYPIEGMDAWRVLRVVIDSGNRVWISTVSNGLFRYDPQSGILESDDAFGRLNEVIAGHELRAIKETHDGSVWFGTHGNGIVKWNELTGDIRHYYSGESGDRSLFSESIRHILEDSNGLLWVGSQDKGLLVYDSENDSFEPINHNGPEVPLFGEETISALMEDDRGNIWFSAFYEDSFYLYYLDQKPRGLRHAVVEDDSGFNLGKHPVLTVYEDSGGSVWIGTDGEGLIRWDTNGVRRYVYDKDNPSSLHSNKISAVIEDNRGQLWIGSLENGLSRLDVESGRFVRVPIGDKVDSLQGKTIWSVFVDGSYLWVGTEKALNVIDTNSGRSLDPSQLVGESLEVPKRGIWSFAKDSRNRLLISSMSGLYILGGNYAEMGEDKTDPFKRITTSRTQSIYVGSDGRIWVVLFGYGLFILNEEDELVRPFPDGMNLEGAVIHSISEGVDEMFWLTTNIGFIQLNGDNGTANVFDSIWGFEAQHFWIHNRLLKKDGKTYFPSRSGLLYFDPSIEDVNHELLRTRVTGLEYFDRVEKPQLRPVIISSIDRLTKELKVDQDASVLRFHYSAFHYPQTSVLEYQTFLAGYDDDWGVPVNHSSISYPPLPAGEYEFQVRARVANQEWGNASPPLSVQVLSPLYLRWWFISLGILVTVCAVYVILRVRLHATRTQKVALEETVARRTLQIEETNAQILRQRDELAYHRDHLEETVKKRTAELEHAKEQAEESSRLKTAFLANMSHEIRTPLNSIVNFSQLLFDERLSERDRLKFKDIVETSSNSLLRLIEDVLDIARLEAGELNLEIQPCDIAGMIRRLGDIYREKVISNGLGLEIRVSIPPGFETEIETDALRLNQVLVNLLDNALKFTEAGSVQFGFEEETADLQFFVRDTGIGITKENQEIIFDRFTKIEENRKKVFPGAGLGLAIAKRLVGLLEGAIWVESTTGIGSVFYFRIPNRRAFRVQPIASAAVKSLEFDWSKSRILVVEDESSNVEVLKAFLTPTAADVVYAGDGKAAVSALKTDTSIDLVLMDLKLPILDGVEATRKIRKFNQGIPIIAQTAFGVSHERMDTLKCGFNDYVTKPLNRERLLRSIDHHLKHKIGRL